MSRKISNSEDFNRAILKSIRSRVLQRLLILCFVHLSGLNKELEDKII